MAYDWTDQRVADLGKYWTAGDSASQIARKLGGGVSRCAVIGKIARLGINNGVRHAASKPRAVGASRAPRMVRATPKLPPARPPAPPPKPIPTEAAISSLSATASLAALDVHACRWPIGDPTADDFGFCGRARDGHPSYCEAHAAAGRSRQQGSNGKALIRGLSRYIYA